MKPPPNTLDEQALQSLSEAIMPLELAPEQRDRMRTRMMESVAERVAPPQQTETVRGESVKWRQFWPGVWVQQLHLDPQTRVQTTLVRMDPGSSIPAHVHGYDEECLVMEGEIRLGDYAVRRGDFHVARAGSAHGDLVAPAGALLMIRGVADSMHAP